jgi:hypothetical protein
MWPSWLPFATDVFRFGFVPQAILFRKIRHLLASKRQFGPPQISLGKSNGINNALGLKFHPRDRTPIPFRKMRLFFASHLLFPC